MRLLVLTLHDLPLAYSVEKQFHPRTIGEFRVRFSRRTIHLLWVALPLGLGVTALSYMNSLPVYFLDRYHGKTTTGYYGGLNAFLLAFNIIAVPLCSSLGPRLSQVFISNRREFVRILRKVSLLVLVIGAVGIPLLYLVAPLLLRVALREEYVTYTREFVALMGIAVFYVICQFCSYALQATRAFWLLLICQGCALVVTVPLCWWFIPGGGLQGAIWVRGISVGLWFGGLITCLIVRFRTTPAGVQKEAKHSGA